MRSVRRLLRVWFDDINIALLCILLSLLVWLAFELRAPAYAHQAPSGLWTYDPVCCSNKDCAPIPAGAVSVVPGVGYRIRLNPGEHAMVTSPIEHIVRFQSALPSGDNEWHACLFPNQDNMRCFYAPPQGM